MALHFTIGNGQGLTSFLNRALEQSRKKKRAKFLKNTFYSSYMIAVENALIDTIALDFPAQLGDGASMEEVKSALEEVFTKDFLDHAMSDKAFAGIKAIDQESLRSSDASEDQSGELMENCIAVAKNGYPSNSNVIEKVQYLSHIEKLFSPSAYSALMEEIEDIVNSLPKEIEEWQAKSTIAFSPKAVKWIIKWLPTPGAYQ